MSYSSIVGKSRRPSSKIKLTPVEVVPEKKEFSLDNISRLPTSSKRRIESNSSSQTSVRIMTKDVITPEPGYRCYHLSSNQVSLANPLNNNSYFVTLVSQRDCVKLRLKLGAADSETELVLKKMDAITVVNYGTSWVVISGYQSNLDAGVEEEGETDSSEGEQTL